MRPHRLVAALTAFASRVPFVLSAPLALVVLVAASATAQRAADRYVAPTNQTVTTRTTESSGSTAGQQVWVDNKSTVPITVYAASLRDCENVRQICGPSKLNVKIKPGRSAVILRVQAKLPDIGFSYRSSFSWRADSSSLEALKVLADAGSSTAGEQLREAAAANAVEDQRVGGGDIMLDSVALVSLGSALVGVRTEPDSITLIEGRGFLLRDVRVIGLDSTGAPLGRLWNLSYRIPGSNVLMASADTVVGAMPGRAEIEIRLRPPSQALTVKLPVIVKPDTTVSARPRR